MNQDQKDKFATKYRRTVETWGEDRVQEDVPILPMQPKRIKRGMKNEFSEFEKYWANRSDMRWTEMPGVTRTNRRSGIKKFISSVSNILIGLVDQTSEMFNPSTLWLNEKEKLRTQLTADDMVIENVEEMDPEAKEAEEQRAKVLFEEDVDIIRKGDRADLLSLLQDMRSIKSRFVLLVEILFIATEQEPIYKALVRVNELLASNGAELNGLKTVEKREQGDRSKPKRLQMDDGWKKLLVFVDKKREKCAKVSENIVAKGDEKFIRNVQQIRNSKGNLMAQLKKMRSLKTRLILMIELLNQAFNPGTAAGEIMPKPVKYEEVYDILWAIEEMYEKNPELDGKFEEEMPPIPRHQSNQPTKDRSLVFDDYTQVETLMAKVREKRANEKDPIKLQLVDMFDKLPPLSKFTHGYKLDAWQKRVLTWIDSGKSTIICAPTSSGKTVLSSYAALPKSMQDIADKKSFFAAANNVGKDEDADEKAADEDLFVDGVEEEFSGSEDEDDEGDDEDEEDSFLNKQQDQLRQAAMKRQAAADARARKAGGGANEEDEFDEDDFSPATAKADNRRRLKLLADAADLNMNRVLFVVPTEPLVWQVGAYFSALLKSEGDRTTKVAIVTDQLVYHPINIYGQMPQIVVGTPQALETELTKCRGRIGHEEYYKKAAKNILPGGFDHFDWVIYDEVHALDGEEGQALQRLIRSMNCKFLALSATVGNAEQLRGWMESVRGEKLDVETITVEEEEAQDYSAVPPAIPTKEMEALSLKGTTAVPTLTINVKETLGSRSVTITDLHGSHNVKDLRDAIAARWASIKLHMQDVDMSCDSLQLFLGDPTVPNSKSTDLKENKETLEACGFSFNGTMEVTVYTHVNLVTHQGRFINLQRYVWNQPMDKTTPGSLKVVSPLSAIESVDQLESGILEGTALSFTSRDSYQLWKKLEQVFPAVEVSDVDPQNFFNKGERITLQRTKEYEDLLKTKLRALASKFPTETQELLHAFSLEDPESTDLDLCELVLELKARDMTPCLPFHLNSFEAIRLFKSLLSGLEKRQIKKHGQYYTKLQAEEKAGEKASAKSKKDFGGNEKELLEAQKAGDVASGPAAGKSKI